MNEMNIDPRQRKELLKHMILQLREGVAPEEKKNSWPVSSGFYRIKNNTASNLLKNSNRKDRKGFHKGRKDIKSFNFSWRTLLILCALRGYKELTKRDNINC